MHFVNQLLKRKIFGSLENGVELMSLITNGKPHTQAAAQLRTTSSTAITLARILSILSLITGAGFGITKSGQYSRRNCI